MINGSIETWAWAIFWSMAPFGESKVGIPYALSKDLNIYLVFLVCFLANLIAYPIMQFFLSQIHNRLFPKRWYKKAAIWVAKRAKKGGGDKIAKYKFWGLVLFVMVPLPGTGVYAGCIAAHLFQIKKRVSFPAIVLGIFLSCVIVWVTTVASMAGVNG